MIQVTFPKTISLSREAFEIEFSSPYIANPSPAFFVLNIEQGFNPVDGDTIKLIFLKEYVIYYFKNTPSDVNPRELPLRGQETESEYLQILIDCFRQDMIWFNFSVTEGVGALFIEIKYKDADSLLSGKYSTTAANLQIGFTERLPRILKPQLSAQIFLYSQKQKEEYLFRAFYNLDSKKCIFRLNDCFKHLTPTVPLPLSRGVTQQLALDSYETFEIYFADKYEYIGGQMITEKLKTTQEYHVLYGRLPLHYDLPSPHPNTSPVVMSCHAFDEKTICETQPDFWYVYFKTTIDVDVKLYCYNAEGALIRTKKIMTIGARANEMEIISTGVQLKSHFAANTISYNIQLESTDGGLNFLGRKYTLQQDVADTQYILYSNGLGGCETHPFSGARKIVLQALKQFYQKEQNSEGQIVGRASLEYEISTTYLDSKETALQLMAIIQEPTWLLDERGEFHKINVLTESIEIELTNPPYFFSFRFKKA